LSYGIGSFMNASSQDESGQWITYAISAPENSPKVSTAFREEMARAIKDGFTADELNEARTGWLQEQSVQRAQDAALASMLATDLYLDRTMAFDAAMDAQVQKLSVTDVNAAVRKFLDPSRFAIVRAGDFSKQAPLQP
jgi:zinc protease